MPKVLPLTEEEQEFAASHFSLVYGYLHKMHLPEDEYYDIVVFGYLKAVQDHFKRIDVIPQDRQNFVAFSFRHMDEAVSEDRRYRMRKMRREIPLSLDSMATESNDDLSFFEVVPDPLTDTEKTVENRDSIERYLAVGTPAEREAIDYLIRGYDISETAKILGITDGAVEARLYGFRYKAKAVRDDREVIRANREKDIIRRRASRAANLEEARAKERAYLAAHRDEINARQRARREANKDEINAKQRAYREAHKDEIKAKQRAYREAHKDEINAKRRAKREANKDEINAKKRAYAEAHRDEINARQRANYAARRAEKQTKTIE